jgi:hypothetical protein
MHWLKLVMCSIVQIRWIIKEWEVFSRDCLLLDLGVVSMSSIDWCLKCCLCVQSSSKQLLMPLSKRNQHSCYKMILLDLILLVESSLL